MSAKVHRVGQKALKLRRDALKKFKEEEFVIPPPAPMDLSVSVHHEQPSSTPPPPSSPPQPSSFRSKNRSTPIKKDNEWRHEKEKKERNVAMLERRLDRLRASINDEKRKIGHYSRKNTDRRDLRNAAARMSLRREKSDLGAKGH